MVPMISAGSRPFQWQQEYPDRLNGLDAKLEHTYIATNIHFLIYRLETEHKFLHFRVDLLFIQ